MTPLTPWMRYLLRFAGTFNLLAALGMIVFHHEGYKLLGVPKPTLVLPIQVMGILVGLFGVGYHLVAHNPIENRNLLVLGFWSKALSSVACLWYVGVGKLPLGFVPVLFFSDIIYLPPFYLIIRRLRHLARQRTTDTPDAGGASENGCRQFWKKVG
jgi:small multidrug resistance pump